MGVEQNNRVIFFGDSICFGQGVSIHKGWVPRLAAHIEHLAARLGRELVIVNASVNGNTTRQALERMPYDVQSHGVGVLLVQFGMNDCNYWLSDKGHPRVSPAAFAANLSEIIQRGITFGAQKILLNTNHPTTRTDELMPGSDKCYQDSNRIYNELIRQVARQHPEHVLLNDIEQIFVKECRNGIRLDDLLLSDKLHLSAKGHDLYYSEVCPHLEQAIGDVYG